MDTIVVELRGGSVGRAEEEELIVELSALVGVGVVTSADALRAEREAAATAVRGRLDALSPKQREEAVGTFRARYGPFGNDAFRLEGEVHRLAAEEAADELLAELSTLSPSERIAAVEEFGRRFWRGSPAFQRLHRTLEEVDPVTADAVPTQHVAPSIGVSPDVLSVAIPAFSGAVAGRIVDLAIDWARRRVGRTRSGQVVRIYGPHGDVVREIAVPARHQPGPD
jgi:hypothetical protein